MKSGSDILKIAVTIFLGSGLVSLPLSAQDPQTLRPSPPVTQAERRLKALASQRDKQGSLLFRYARELKASNPGRAVQKFDEFLILYPDHEWVFYALQEKAGIFDKRNQPRRAVKFYIRAYRKAHNEERGARSYLRAGRIETRIGRIKSACKIFREIQDLRVSFPIRRMARLELSALGSKCPKSIDKPSTIPNTTRKPVVRVPEKTPVITRARVKKVKKTNPIPVSVEGGRKVGQGIISGRQESRK